MERHAKAADRILLAQLFLVAGIGKLTVYADTQGYVAAVGVPGALLPLVIGLEIGAAPALILGWQTRLTAMALAGVSLASATIFHADFRDHVQTIPFMRNLAIAAGLLRVATQDSASNLSLDRRRLTAASA